MVATDRLAGAAGRVWSVLVKQTDAARWHVAVVAEVQTQVAAAVDVAAQADRVLQRPASDTSLRLYTGCRDDNCLQCFDAVGWAAGRASGL